MDTHSSFMQLLHYKNEVETLEKKNKAVIFGDVLRKTFEAPKALLDALKSFRYFREQLTLLLLTRLKK
jgi:hypothetical protein